MQITELTELSEPKRVYLSRNVFRELVLGLQAKHNSQRKAAKVLDINQSQLSRYLNGKQRSISTNDLSRILQTLGRKNITLERIEMLNEYRKRSIAKANAKLEWSPVPFTSVAVKDKNEVVVINVLKWLRMLGYIERLRKRKGLVVFGGMNVYRNTLVLGYKVFNKQRLDFKEHVSIVPRFLKINVKLMNLLGLWMGDNFGGSGRVGVINTNLSLLKRTSELLKKILAQPQSSLIGQVMTTTKLSMSDKQYYASLLSEVGVQKVNYVINSKSYGDLTFAVYVNNSLLRRLLNFLKDNLQHVFSKVKARQRGAFYAGLFDADGNVNRRDVNLRWSTMNRNFACFLMEWLRKDGFSPKYDGANVKIGYCNKTREGDFALFKKSILLHLSHPQKLNAAKGMLR